MASPKKKISRSRRDKRRYNGSNSMKNPHTASCPNCGSSWKPHTVCVACGQYKGKQVMAGRNDEAVA